MEFAGENFLYFGIQQYIDIFKNLLFFPPLPFPPSLSFLLFFFNIIADTITFPESPV